MKKVVALLASVAVLILSCKKSGPSNSYYMKATVNGVPMTFNAHVTAKEDSTSGFTLLTIGGSTNTTDSETLQLQIINTVNIAPIVAATYKESDYSDFGVYGTYVLNNSGEAYRAGQADSLTYPFQIVITNINSSSVKGTFTGVFYNLIGAMRADSIETFTNGEFYAPLQP